MISVDNLLLYNKMMTWQYDNNDALLEVFDGSMPAYDRLGRRSQLAVLIPSKM
jgi:hypothetical protein